MRLSSYINQRKDYDREREDGSVMSREQMDKALAEINQTTEKQRANMVHIGVKRAPIFIAGSVLLKTIYDALGAEQLIASYKSAKDSIIMELIDEDQNGASDKIG